MWKAHSFNSRPVNGSHSVNGTLFELYYLKLWPLCLWNKNAHTVDTVVSRILVSCAVFNKHSQVNLGKQHWIQSLNLTSQLFLARHVDMKAADASVLPDMFQGLLQRTGLLGCLK